VANIINLTYNIPQVWKTFKTKSTGDFSETFLVMRILGNMIWIGYAIEINSMLMLINNMVVIFSTIFLGYYKVLEIIKKRKTKTKTKRELTFDNSQTNHEKENENDNNDNNDNINNLKGLSEKDKLLTEFTVSF
jgi:uncharacterized protein with PQ loop repeat